MRVLYFNQYFNTPSGTGSLRVYEFARALLARGHGVTVVCGMTEHLAQRLARDGRRGWFRGMVDGIDVLALPVPYSQRYSLPRRALSFLRYAWRAVPRALREPHDLIFASSTPLTAGIPAIAAKLLGRRAPFVFEVRDLWPELPRALGLKNPLVLGGMSALEWMSYRCANAAIGLAPGIVAGIRRRARPGLPIAMVPNAGDLELFHPRMRGPLALPGLEPGDFVAGFTGAHGLANGLGAVLDAAAVLQARGARRVKLLFIGEGKEKPGLEARARAEGLANCVFHPAVPKAEIGRITASLGCGLMVLLDVPAFYFGTSPNKFFDYIAAGVPVLNNYPGWLAGLIRQHDCGLAVPPRDPAAFADALVQMAADPARCAVMGRNARRLAETEFARASLADRFVDCLEAVCAGRARSGEGLFA